MNNNLWSGIVYGRTYETDFRFLALPQDWLDIEKNKKNIDWVWQHIRVTMRSANYLRDHPEHICWSLFKKQEYWVVGITCMASQLSDRFFEDGSNKPRELYVFVGYVTQKHNPSLPAFPDIDPFKKLYENIATQQWRFKPFEKGGKTPILLPYETVDFKNISVDKESVVLNEDFLEALNLNNDPSQIRLWADILNQNHDKDEKEYEKIKQWLWEKTLKSPEQTMSVCFGLEDQKNAVGGPFLNITVLNATFKVGESFTIPNPLDNLSEDDNSEIEVFLNYYVEQKLDKKVNDKKTGNKEMKSTSDSWMTFGEDWPLIGSVKRRVRQGVGQVVEGVGQVVEAAGQVVEAVGEASKNIGINIRQEDTVSQENISSQDPSKESKFAKDSSFQQRESLKRERKKTKTDDKGDSLWKL